MPQDPIDNLDDLADAVSAMAQRRSKDLQLEALAQGLQTRLNELRQEESGVRMLSGAGRLMRTLGAAPLDRRSRTLLSSIEKKVDRLRLDFDADPSSITKANAVCTEDLRKLSSLVGDQLTTFWRSHVLKATPTDGVLAVFEKHARFRSIVVRLRELKAKLESIADRLPESDSDILKLHELQSQIKVELERLPELTESIKRFLRNSISPGVILSDLLEDPELMQWIRREKMDSELRVYSGQAVTMPR